MEFIIILGLFFIVIGSLSTYFILKKLKGDLVLKLSKLEFNFDEEITGNIKLKAKKEIESNSFTVFLIKEKYVSSGKNGHWVELYHMDEELEGKRKYRRNFTNFYDFKFIIPPGYVPYEPKKTFLGTLFKSQIRWKILARVDAVGIDLDTHKIIKIKDVPLTTKSKYSKNVE